MKEFIKRNKINIILILIFLILPWLFFKDSVKLGSVGNGDTNYYTLPLWDLIVNSVKNGEFPFWNKYIYSGFPLFANPQTSILYPILWILYFIFPLVVAYNISVLIHFSLAGIFTFIFLNRYNLDKFASFCGGLVFMFSGVMIIHKGHTQMLYTIIWFPLILYFLDKFREHKRFEFIFAGSIFYAFAFFGGHPQMFFYGSMVILLYIIYYSFIYARKSYYFLCSAAIFIITTLIISIQLFPIYELMGHSIRDVLDFNVFSFFSYSKEMLPTLISPYIYGYGPSGVSFFGSISYIETLSYFGVTTIPFLIIGFFSKNKDKYFWIFILVFSFVLVMGINTPFYKLMYHIPLYNKFRIPTRNWFEFGLALSILVGFGFDYYIRNFNKKIKNIIISLISFLGLIGIALGFSNLILKKISISNFLNNLFLKENIGLILQTTTLKNYVVYIPLIFIFALIVLLVFSIFKRNKFMYIFFILLIFFDLRLFANHYQDVSDASYVYKDLKKNEVFSFIKSETQPYRFFPIVDSGYETIYPNRNIYYEVDSIAGIDPLMLNDYRYLIGMTIMDNKEQSEKLMRSNNVLSILNTKYIIYFKPENYNLFEQNITKIFYEDKGSIVSDKSLSGASLKGTEIEDKNSIVFNNETGVLRYFKIPVKIENNNSYLVSFEIKENFPENNKSLLNNNIFVDFNAEGYDSSEQEFFLNPGDISADLKTIRKVIFSGIVPVDKEIYLRIFTQSDGEIEIKNLKLNKVNVYNYNNYQAIYNKDILILKNNDYLPRFYFTEKVINVSDISEAHKTLWEIDAIWEKDRFDPKVETLIEKMDFNTVEFDTSNAEVEIQEYRNNNAKLNIAAKSDQFLVFSDVYYPGWKAYVDGKQVKIYKVNGILKGIFITEGKHIIEFNYLPNNFWIYFSISITTLISTIVSIIVMSYKRKKFKDLEH